MYVCVCVEVSNESGAQGWVCLCMVRRSTEPKTAITAIVTGMMCSKLLHSLYASSPCVKSSLPIVASACSKRVHVPTPLMCLLTLARPVA